MKQTNNGRMEENFIEKKIIGYKNITWFVCCRKAKTRIIDDDDDDDDMDSFDQKTDKRKSFPENNRNKMFWHIQMKIF